MFEKIFSFFERNREKLICFYLILFLYLFYNSQLNIKIIKNIGTTEKAQIYIQKILNKRISYYIIKIFFLMKGLYNILIIRLLNILLYVINHDLLIKLINKIKIPGYGRTNLIHKINSKFQILVDNTILINLFLLTGIIFKEKKLNQINLNLINLLSSLNHIFLKIHEIKIFHTLLFDYISIGDIQFLNKYHFFGSNIERLIKGNEEFNVSSFDSLFSLLFYIDPELFFHQSVNYHMQKKLSIVLQNKYKSKFLINSILSRYKSELICNPYSSLPFNNYAETVSISIIGQVRYPIHENNYLTSNIKPILQIARKNIYISNYNWKNIGFKIPFNHNEFCSDHTENLNDYEKQKVRENNINFKFNYKIILEKSLEKKINLETYYDHLESSMQKLLTNNKNNLSFSQNNHILDEENLSFRKYLSSYSLNRSEINQSKFLYAFINSLIKSTDGELNFFIRPDLILDFKNSIKLFKSLINSQTPIAATDYDPQALLQPYVGTGDRIFIFNKAGLHKIKNYLLKFSNNKENYDEDKFIFEIWINLSSHLKNKNILCGHSWPQYLLDRAGIMNQPIFNLKVFLPRIQVKRSLLKSFLDDSYNY